MAKFLRQVVWDSGQVHTPGPEDYGDAIEFEQKKVNGQPMTLLWTVQNGQRVSGLLLSDTTSVRLSIV